MRDIQKLVRSLGIGGNYQGYRYLLYALSLCLQNEDYLLSVSKLLYPEIAHTYQDLCKQCRAKSTYRCIRLLGTWKPSPIGIHLSLSSLLETNHRRISGHTH